MWNFDGSYQAEAQRRAELYTEAELLRAAQDSDAKVGLVARLGQLLVRIGAGLQGMTQAPTHATERR